MPKYRAVVALSDRESTRERPLHFVLLVCHADVADEAPIKVVERHTRTLAEAVLTRLQNQQSNVSDVLHSLNTTAVATGRYFSIAAGRLTQRDVSVVAVGEVVATTVSGDTWTPIITPNVVRVGGNRILDASFGIGFKEEAVQRKDLVLTDGMLLLIMVGGDPAPGESILQHHSAQTLLEDVVNAARVPVPIVAVAG
jgi:hypothetical protein